MHNNAKLCGITNIPFFKPKIKFKMILKWSRLNRKRANSDSTSLRKGLQLHKYKMTW